MPHIHWIGTGLSAIPGIKKLIENGHQITVWNRTVLTAEKALKGCDVEIRKFSISALSKRLDKKDILVSMLPGEWHVPLAKLCLEKTANFVSSSYISPEMLELSESFEAANLASVNEVGLDPGIDHSNPYKLIQSNFWANNMWKNVKSSLFGEWKKLKIEFCNIRLD